MYAFEDQSGTKTGFKTLDKGRQWKHFNLRVQGLPLVSDGA